MNRLLIPIFICIALNAPAQHNFTLSIPKSEEQDVARLSAYIHKNNRLVRDQIAAAYNWVTANISYSADSSYYFNWSADQETQVAATLRRRKGVCENYSAVFTDILNKMGIRSFVVHGYTRQDSYLNQTGHAWSAVYYDNAWFLCDPTWDAGVQNQKYFMVPPSWFIRSHMPYDPLWQLTTTPISHKDFRAGKSFPVSSENNTGVSDSVFAFAALDSLHRFEASATRIKNAGFSYEQIELRYKLMKMRENILREDQYHILYEDAVSFLNKALVSLNNFIDYRNSRFLPVKPEPEVRAYLADSKTWLDLSLQNADILATEKGNYQYSPDALKERHKIIVAKLKVQQGFLGQYYNAIDN